ncbi:MAG: 50S ribosomal protein L4 [Candidatus Omnitrophica bacterium CG11_big_fil_rev_8_21_14_0_20_63_9]|nr:MAG: 50S ribosomal protein L4 [Candidatus Omnitrophica bacterium CG11_big_fil_rev_8_21_14_0_20_63_9]
MNATVFNLEGKKVGQLTLGALWDGHVNLALLSQAVAMYRSNRRAGTASTKTRGDVSGGGRKPWKQKHTGRARAGSTRSPLWRHGGVALGPHPKSFYYRLPQTIRRKALLESLKGKLRDAELVIIDRLAAEQPKTKPFARLAKTFEVTGRSVIVLDQAGEPLVKSLRNLAHFELREAANLNAFDVLNAKKVLVSKGAFERLEQRIKEPHANGD